MPEKPQDFTPTIDEDVMEELSASLKEVMKAEKPRDITYARDRGIMKTIIRSGVGDETPPYGVRVKVQYTGKLKDGTVFETTWAEPAERGRGVDEDYENENETDDRIGKPLEFELGEGSVVQILAWDMCVASMKKGEVASFKCRPDYAYGEPGAPPKIPPNATLFFEIEMIGWDPDLTKEKDGGVLKTAMLRPGKGYSRPKEGAIVDIHITGVYKGEIFENRDVTFPQGEGAEYDICEGIEIGLRSFIVQEKSKLKIKSKYAFGATGKLEYNIPPNADVEYTIRLKNFEPLKSPYTLRTFENVAQAENFKEKGTKYFKEGKLPLAVKIYKRIEDYVGKEFRTGEELYEKCWRKDLMVAMHLNLALCYLKMNKDKEAKNECDKALDLEPNNEKALFRRGLSCMNLREPELAMEDFQRVVRLNPKNGSAVKNNQLCKEMMNNQRSQEKKLYSSMF